MVSPAIVQASTAFDKVLDNLRSMNLGQIRSRQKQIDKIRMIVGSQMFSSDLRKAVAKLENEIGKLKDEVE